MLKTRWRYFIAVFILTITCRIDILKFGLEIRSNVNECKQCKMQHSNAHYASKYVGDCVHIYNRRILNGIYTFLTLNEIKYQHVQAMDAEQMNCKCLNLCCDLLFLSGRQHTKTNTPARINTQR